MKTALLVEDNPMNMDLAEQVLEDTYRVITAENGALALEVLGAQPVDIVLMDLSMPVLDGWDALTEIRAVDKWKTLPVVAVSAHAQSEQISRALAHGFDAFVTKPLDEDELLAVMAKLLAR